MLKDKKKNWTNKFITKLENLELEDPKQYWKSINELRNMPKINNIYNSTDFEKFYKNLFSTYTHKEKSHHSQINVIIEELLKSSNDKSIEPDFTLNEINESLIRLKNNKTAGPDRIPAEMIKNSPKNVLKVILLLINIKNAKIT